MRFAGELVFVSALLTKGAHGAAGLVSVFQAVEHHVVINAVVADADAAAAFGQEVRRVGHALHAAGDHEVTAAGHQLVVRQHGGLHARAAHFGQRDRAGAGRQATLEARLTRRRLALAGHEAITKQHFVYFFGRDTGALNSGADGGATQVVRSQAGEVALKAAHGGARSAKDDDGFRHKNSLK